MPKMQNKRILSPRQLDAVKKALIKQKEAVMKDDMMKMIEMMMSKHKGMKHGGEYGKEAEDMEEGYEEDEGYEQDKVTIKFCGKDALKKAHDLLMSSYKK